MISAYDKIIFDYYSEKGRHSYSPMETDEAYDLIHYLYRGSVVGDTTDKVQKIVDTPNVQFMGMACKGSIQRSVETAALLSQFIPNAFDKDSIEDNARLTNALTGDAVRNSVEILFRAQDAADELAPEGDIPMSIVGHGEADLSYKPTDDLRHQIMKGFGNSQLILECYGAMKAMIAKAKRTEVFPSQTVIKDVTLGNDIPKLLTDELINLAIPELQHLTNLRFVTSQMLQYHLEEEKGVGRGALTIYVDVSGSMELTTVGLGEGYVSRIVAAAGVCLALVNELESQKRKYEIKFFNETIIKGSTSDTPEECKLKLLSIFIDGGTSIRALFDDVKTIPKDHDVLILSDAEFGKGITTPDFDCRVGLIEFSAGTSGSFDTSKLDMAIKINHIDDFKPLTNFAI